MLIFMTIYKYLIKLKQLIYLMFFSNRNKNIYRLCVFYEYSNKTNFTVKVIKAKSKQNVTYLDGGFGDILKWQKTVIYLHI